MPVYIAENRFIRATKLGYTKYLDVSIREHRLNNRFGWGNGRVSEPCCGESGWSMRWVWPEGTADDEAELLMKVSPHLVPFAIQDKDFYQHLVDSRVSVTAHPL